MQCVQDLKNKNIHRRVERTVQQTNKQKIPLKASLELEDLDERPTRLDRLQFVTGTYFIDRRKDE